MRDVRNLTHLEAPRKRKLVGFQIYFVSRSHIVDFIYNKPQEPKKSFSKETLS